jgi:hypothetical protein
MRTNGRAAERLNEVQAQLRDLREQRGAAAKARDCAVEVLPVGPGGDVNTKSPEFIAADAARQRVLALDSQIEMLRGAERDLLELMSGNGGPALAYSFLADPEKMQTLENVAKGSTRLPSLEQGGLALGQYMSADEMPRRSAQRYSVPCQSWAWQRPGSMTQRHHRSVKACAGASFRSSGLRFASSI